MEGEVIAVLMIRYKKESKSFYTKFTIIILESERIGK